MSKTGIFFHYQQGERLKDFPQALKEILSCENVYFYDAFYPNKPPSSFDLEVIPLELIYRVHTPEMVENVIKSLAFEGALLSASGTVSAARRIWKGDITNAFVFTGYGDHHAGRNFFGGGCYLNGAAIAIQELRENFHARKLVIVETDAHHGDGTWQLFEDDREVLYLCFCSGNYVQVNNKINVTVPFPVSDEDYLHLVISHLTKLVKDFQPETIFWNWGYDGTIGEYGDIGLTPDVHVKLACEIKSIADTFCNGRLIVVLCGGSSRNLASYIIPKIIKVLASHRL